MRKTLLIVGALLCIAPSYAQEFTNDWGNYLKPSPGGNSGAIDVSVNEATGAIAYNMALYAINQNDQSFPIGIGYYSTGVKIDDYASFVGLGWNLNAGGMISKMVRGLDDEDPVKGYRANYANPSPATVNEVKTGARDGEPDVYVFSVFGRSGKFVFDPSASQYVPLNAEDILINWVTTPTGHFEITDENGAVYHFTLQEQTSLKSITIGPALNITANLGTVVSGWFLTKVVLADHSQITISYNARTITDIPTGTKESDIQRFFPQNTNSECDPNHANGSTIGISYRRVEYYTSYLTQRMASISYKTGAVDFIYSNTSRSDMPGDYALEYVVIKDKQSYTRKKYQLSYTSHSNRLLLQSVVQYEGYSTASLVLNSFTYYTDHAIPAPGSTVSQDEYGYFNGALTATTGLGGTSSTTTLLPRLDPPNFHEWMSGANRGFGTTSQMQTLMLRSITNTQGGKLSFVYEANMFNGNDPYNAQIPSVQNRQGPGLRIARTESDNNFGRKIYTRYKYEDNNGISTGIYINQYAFSNNLSRVFVISNRLNPGPDQSVAMKSCQGALRYSDQRTRVPMSFSSPIYYKSVKVMEFTNPNDESGSSNGYLVKSFSYDPDLYNTAVHSVREYMFGNLTGISTFSKAGQAVGSQEFTYTYTHGTAYAGKSVYLQALDINVDNKGTATGVDDQYSYVYYHNFIKYNLYVGRRDLAEKKNYKVGSIPGIMHHTSETYEYDNKHNLLFVHQHTNGTRKHTTKLKRCYHYASFPSGDQMNKAINHMQVNHIHAAVLESFTTTVTATNEVVTSGAVQLYRLDNVRSIVLPTKQMSLRQTGGAYIETSNGSGTFTFSPNYETLLEVDAVDENDRPTQVNSRKDTVATLNNNEGTPYCAVSKSKINEIAYCGFEYYEGVEINGPKSKVGNFSFSVPCATTAPGFAGEACFNLGTCNSTIINETPLSSAKKYVLQCWINGSVQVTKSGGGIPGTLLRTVGNWQLKEYLITGATTIFIHGTGLIDEIKLFPLGTAMTTTCIDALGRTIAESDANNQYTRYEYDDLGRIRTVYDINNNIIKRYEYAIQTAQ